MSFFRFSNEKMSNPSQNIQSLKNRAYIKVEQFIEQPHALKSLTYAKYKPLPKNSHYHTYATRMNRVKNIRVNRSLSRHKRHVMHSQHRLNCVNVLKHLILRLNFQTLECLLVAPDYRVARPLYVNEIARKCGISKRTTQSCLESLTVAGYIRRHKDTFKNMRTVVRHKDEDSELKNRIFLTPKLIKEIQCDVAFVILLRKMSGLNKKKAVKNSNKPSGDKNKPQHFYVKEEVKEADRSQEPASRAAGAKALSLLKSIFPKPPD